MYAENPKELNKTYGICITCSEQRDRYHNMDGCI